MNLLGYTGDEIELKRALQVPVSLKFIERSFASFPSTDLKAFHCSMLTLQPIHISSVSPYRFKPTNNRARQMPTRMMHFKHILNPSFADIKSRIRRNETLGFLFCFVSLVFLWFFFSFFRCMGRNLDSLHGLFLFPLRLTFPSLVCPSHFPRFLVFPKQFLSSLLPFGPHLLNAPLSKAPFLYSKAV